jgi:hypothetical protein
MMTSCTGGCKHLELISSQEESNKWYMLGQITKLLWKLCGKKEGLNVKISLAKD